MNKVSLTSFFAINSSVLDLYSLLLLLLLLLVKIILREGILNEVPIFFYSTIGK